MPHGERTNIPVRVRLPVKLHDALHEMAEATGKTLTDIQVRALWREVNWWQAKRLAEERKVDP